MFKHKAQPSVIYSYKAFAPTLNGDLVWDQMRKRHLFRNQLVEVEHKRREKCEAAIRQHCPRIAELDGPLADARKTLKSLREASRAANKAARRRVGLNKKEIVAARQVLEDVKLEHGNLRRATYRSASEHGSNQVLRGELNAIGAWANGEDKRLYNECKIAWGSRLQTCAAMRNRRKGAPPKFRRWDASGKTAVQLQKGLPVNDVDENDTRLRIREVKIRSRGKVKAVASLRIGSARRKPIWADIPFHMHRPLPAGANIKWAWLLARRVGAKVSWKIQFTVSRACGWAKPDLAKSGKVGIDLGWRKVEDGRRVACWVGDDGARGTLVIPTKELSRWQKAKDLRSIRDKNFNEVLRTITLWLKAHENLPEWLRTRAATIHAWRSEARLASLVIQWRNARFDGDDEIFDQLERWRRHDKHLLQWEVNQEGKAIRWRNGVYRKFAAMIRRRYHTVILEDINWRLLQERDEEDEEDEGFSRPNDSHVIAAVGTLASYLAESAAETRRVDPAFTTATCHKCGYVCEWNQAAEVCHTCEHCGETWDQDYNAAENLLNYEEEPEDEQPKEDKPQPREEV